MAARNALRVRFLRALSPKEFAALYEAPGRDATRIGVSGSAIHTAVYSLARTTLAARPRGERSPLGQLRSQVDLRKPVEVRFNNNGQLSVSFPTDRGAVALNL
jgi:hypothetical protein